MDHITVQAITPESDAGQLPADRVTIQACAETTLALLKDGNPVPSRGVLEALASEIQGMVRVLVDDLADKCPEEHRAATSRRVVQACRWLRTPLGDDLITMRVRVRGIARIAVELCEMHRDVISG